MKIDDKNSTTIIKMMIKSLKIKENYLENSVDNKIIWTIVSNRKKSILKRLGDRVSDNRLASFTSVQDNCVLNLKAIINHPTIKKILSLDQLLITIYICIYPIINYKL